MTKGASNSSSSSTSTMTTSVQSSDVAAAAGSSAIEHSLKRKVDLETTHNKQAEAAKRHRVNSNGQQTKWVERRASKHQAEQNANKRMPQNNRNPTTTTIRSMIEATSNKTEGGTDDSCKPTAAAASAKAKQNICAACAKPIRERYLLEALEKQWHEDCLKCACCDCRLGEVGNTLFTHSDKILCRRDFLRIFGQHGLCAACNRSIPPYELVMRAQQNTYHMDCFACQQCQYRFCVGDKFHLTEKRRVLCVLCHSEQQQQQQQVAQNGEQQDDAISTSQQQAPQRQASPEPNSIQQQKETACA